MATDKSLFFYGSLYHRFLDPELAEGRRVALGLIAAGSSVLDIACGTGQLCFELRQQKRCSVVGVDLSLRMLEFARRSDPLRDIVFAHEDATDLSAFADQSFDYATMLMLMHELSREQQIRALAEALRVARKSIIIDSAGPLSWNAGGIGTRAVERTLGRGHNRNFKAFLARGGTRGVVEGSGLPLIVEHSAVFWHGCRQVVVAVPAEAPGMPA